MRVLAIVTRKGGSGKTTLAAHLAVQAARAGAGPVGLIDADPQGSLADWWAARAEPGGLFLRGALTRLKGRLETLRRRGARLAVVDTPPASGKALAPLVRQADLVLIPVRPSPHDIRRLTATLAAIEPLGTPLVFVINAATRGTQLSAQAVTLISQYGPLAPAIVHNRVAFVSSMIDGRTAMELSGTAAASGEIARLWDYLDARLVGRAYRPEPA